jgi:DNA polymerase elongation subunit (family B)
MIERRAKQATFEEVDKFLQGSNPMEHVIKVECGYNDKYATIIWRDNDYKKHYTTQPFYPFCWAKSAAGQSMCKGDRTKLKLLMQKHNIGCKGLIIANDKGEKHERMINGYNIMFYATEPMTNQEFNKFFDEVDVPLSPKDKHWSHGKNYYKVVAPNEQFMISTGIRLFKGYESYDDILRMQFDIETTGLDKKNDLIDQIGIRTNKGLTKIIQVSGDTKEEKLKNGLDAINQMFDVINEVDPDILSGYNSEGFDHEFFDVFLREHFGMEMSNVTKRDTIPFGCYKRKRQSVLKLGGEMEYYYPTIMWGKHITDCLFSVRRAQALDSNMKKASLKYVTKYSKINKKNRVYVPGKIINTTWEDKTLSYGFNDENGDWYKISEKKPLKDGYQVVSGEYIVNRYLEDDLWETDKVELRYNESNFLVGKMLPVNFERVCTMGTATIWKYIMMAWSYEHDLAIPNEISSRSFTGGLSRLLTVGYIPNVLKLDYNSLYPSIILTFFIKTLVDISGAMPAMLEYILTQREHYKELKSVFSKEASKINNEKEEFIKSLRLEDEYKNLTDEEFGSIISKHPKIIEYNEKYHQASANSTRNDKLQLPLKITANAFFGSFGAGGGIFNWSDMDCAEETTCCGRQMLRLMLKWFSGIGYEGIVCDSVTGDTPLFVRNKETKLISIKRIESLFDVEKTIYASHGREYDYEFKDYEVLCRTGWVEPKYLYRHKTDKDIYKVEDKKNEMIVEVTKDHSLFDENRKEIKPTEIKNDTKLEYYSDKTLYLNNNILDVDKNIILNVSKQIKNKQIKEIPEIILNSNIEDKEMLLTLISGCDITLNNYNKTVVAGINYIKNCIIENNVKSEI